MKLVAKSLSGERAGQLIFANINFCLNEGEALIITGSNGSGKSTLLRVIAGLLPAASGSVTIKNGGQHTRSDDQRNEEDAMPHERMHYLGHLNALKPALSVEENLNFWQQYCGDALIDADAALEAVALRGIGSLPAAYLSAGQKRRVSIARLLVSYKPVWVVDEPTAALDKASENLFAKLMQDHMAKGGMVIAATHQPLGIGDSEMSGVKSLNLDQIPIEEDAGASEQMI